MEQQINVDWPLWDRQRECIESPANDQFFGGASEGGKSYLCRVGANLAGIQCNNIQITFLRKKSSDLEGYLDGNKGFRELLYPLTSTGQVEVTLKGIRYPNSNKLTFKHAQDARQFDTAQGSEQQILIKEEGPQIEEKVIRYFDGWTRITPEHLAAQPKFWQTKLPWKLTTGNPTGVSVGFFKRNYVKPVDDKGKPIAPFTIFPFGSFRRQFVPSFASDNLSVNLEAHTARLAEIGDPALAKALDEGDWEQLVGSFYPEWNEKRHVIKEWCQLPAWWYRYRAFDWGTADPAWCGWYAISDGQVFKDEKGRERWFPKGALILYDEWYIADPKTRKGLRLRNEEMAVGIVRRSDINQQRVITLTDSKPFQDDGGEGPAIIFERNKCPLELADTSRVAGWTRWRDLMIGQEFGFNDDNEPILIPMYYVMPHCIYARELIPVLQRHPAEHKKEDAQEHGEPTHVCDPNRYAAMAHNHSVIKHFIPPIDVQTNRIIEQMKKNKQSVRSITKSMGLKL